MSATIGKGMELQLLTFSCIDPPPRFNEGPRPPRRRIPLSPESMAYRTRSNVRAIERRRAATRQARASRVLQWREGGSGPNNAIELDD
jgi:hypothetical protein